jgi:hypothetical protein
MDSLSREINNVHLVKIFLTCYETRYFISVFTTAISFYGETLAQATRLPCISCPRLLIQYIRNYSRYLKAVTYIHKPRPDMSY